MKIIAASLLLASAAAGQMWPQNAQWRASTATHAEGSSSVAASDVTVLDVAGYFASGQAEGVFAELYREGWRTYADTASLPEDDLGGCDGTNRIALALVSTQTGGPLLYLCPTTGGSWTPLFVPLGAATSSGLTMATARLLGRTAASSGAVEEITVSSPLTLSAGALGIGTLGVANGGTGATSLPAYAPVCGGTTTTGAVQSCGAGQDNAGYVWTSNGPSALPSWQAASGGGAAGSDTQVTFNNAGTAAGDSGLTFNATTNTLTASGVNIGTIAAGQGLEANGYALPYVRLIGYDSDMWLAANKLTLTSGSGRFGELTHDRLGFGRDTCLAFFNHPDPAQGSADSGFCRSSPGILWATDGSSGVGFWRDVPTDSPPACADAARGVHYFDDSLGEECSCKGASGAASWQQMDGGGAC